MEKTIFVIIMFFKLFTKISKYIIYLEKKRGQGRSRIGRGGRRWNIRKIKRNISVVIKTFYIVKYKYKTSLLFSKNTVTEKNIIAIPLL